jgi:hypothetical protein
MMIQKIYGNRRKTYDIAGNGFRTTGNEFKK